MRGGLVFLCGGGTLKGEGVGFCDGVGGLDASGEGFGHVEGEAVIEQGEGLQWGGGVGAFGGGEGDVGKIEVIENVDDAGAGVLMIDGAAVGFGAVGIEREVSADVVLGEFVEAEAGAAHGFELHLTGDGEQGVAEFFGAEAAGREAPEEAGGFVELETVWMARGALPVGRPFSHSYAVADTRWWGGGGGGGL